MNSPLLRLFLAECIVTFFGLLVSFFIQSDMQAHKVLGGCLMQSVVEFPIHMQQRLISCKRQWR